MILRYLVSIVFFAVLSSAQQSEYFINPPPSGAVHDYTRNPVWQAGSTQTLQWYTEWSDNNLKMYQNDNENYTVVFPDEHSGFQTYSWAVAFANYNSSLTPVFYFRINNINNDSQTFSSHYFNVSGNSSPSNALSGVTSTLLPAAPTTTITGQSSTSTPTTQATVSSAPQSAGLSSGAKAGIGVGAAVAIIVIVSLLGALVWSRHKIALHAAHTQETGPYTQENKITPNAVGSFDSRLPGYFEAPVEMEETKTWNRHPQELQS